MDPREALNYVIETFSIKAADVAERAGIDAGQLSRFRKGHVDFLSFNLYRIINALEPEQRALYYALLQEGRIKKTKHQKTLTAS